jgi:multidrug resistance protein, MATE family
LGVEGTALATTLAEIGGLIAGLIIVTRHFGSRLGVAAARLFDTKQFRRMAAVNRDIMIRNVALLSAVVFFTRQGALAGDVTLAANAILNNILLVGVFFLDGISTAAEQLCGRSLGANNRQAFGRAVKLSLWWSLCLSFCLSLSLFLGGGLAIDAMAKSDIVRAEARQFLPYAALTPLAGSLAFTFDGVFVGATWNAAMRNLMLLAVAGYLVVWWLLAPYGNHGLWAAWLSLLLMRGGGQMLAYPSLERRTFRR